MKIKYAEQNFWLFVCDLDAYLAVSLLTLTQDSSRLEIKTYHGKHHDD